MVRRLITHGGMEQIRKYINDDWGGEDGIKAWGLDGIGSNCVNSHICKYRCGCLCVCAHGHCRWRSLEANPEVKF